MSFNIDSAVLSNFLLRPFMNEDVNIFYNKATKRVQREQRADHVRTLACVPTSYGAMMVAGRAFRTENAEEAEKVIIDNKLRYIEEPDLSKMV